MPIARNSRPLPMHRIAYTDLAESQVIEALRPAASGPKSASVLSQALVGMRLKIVTDEGGPALEYRFRTGRELEFSENGAKPVRAAYGALECRRLVLVSHSIPGTARSLHLVIDLHTRLVTVFEVYFNGYAQAEIAAAAEAKREPRFRNGRRNREAQRKLWFGYVDDGGGAPANRHAHTNRLEGKGIHWQLDNGVGILEFYLSILYSNFIELTRFGSEMTVAAPSDYIRVSDHQFIYSRIECEFSGTFTLQVIDLFDMTLRGVRLGLTEKDALEYELYSGRGDIVGQIATFEAFGNNGETRDGPRRVYRPLETFEVMTDDEVKAQALHHAHAFGNGEGSGTTGMSGYKSELITRFAGRKLTARMDSGPTLEYDFVDGRQLKWRHARDSHWREAWYEMYEPDDQLYFFAHLLDAEFPRSCAMVAFDMKNGLSTIIKGTTGTSFRNNETTATHYFGVFETEGAPTPPGNLRHGWTDEMVGEAVTWNYQPGNPGLTSMHFYATPSTYSWIIFLPDGAGGMQWSSPGWYSSLRDGVCLMTWVEEACNGTLGVICFNQRTMRNAGFDFNVGSRGLQLKVVGARARHAGRFDLKQYLGQKS